MLAKRVAPAVTTPRETPETFRLLVEGIQDFAIFMLDGAGRVATWNTGAEHIKGYRAEEIVGQHFSRFYPPEAVAEGKPARLLALAARDGRVEDEGWRIRKDGSRFWADVIITALRDSEGAVIGFAKVTRDVTARKEAQDALHRSEQTFQLLVESIQDCAIFMLDPDGRVASWNAVAERIKGYHAHEIMGEHFSTFYPPDDVAQGKPQWALEIAEREGRHEDEGWRVRKDGTRFWANTVISPMRDSQGGLIGYAKMTRSLTQLHRANQALAQTNQELERFSYSVSHDLRAPLRAINGYAQALWEDHAARLDDEGKRLLAVIRDSAKLGGQQIDGRLSFSRLGRQGLARAPVDVTALAESVVAELRQTQGTRVGLALAQRIIQRHGRRIWAEGKVNEGATFRFTLTGAV